MDRHLWIQYSMAAVPLLAALVGVVVARILSLARVQHRHVRVLDRLGPPRETSSLPNAPAGTVATFEGTLGAVADEALAPVISFHPYGTSFLDEANVYALTLEPESRVCINLAGGIRAVLDGPLQVLSGSVESEDRVALDRAARFGASPLRTRGTRGRDRGQFRAVFAGDRVRVRGRVEPAPDDDAAYRESSKVVRILPASSGDPGAERVIPLASSSTPRTERVRGRVAHMAPYAALALASAGSAWALFAFASEPVAQPHTSGPQAKQAPACRAAVISELEANRWDRAAEVRKGCDDPYTRAILHYAQGEFPAASDDFAAALALDAGLTPSLAETETHLFAKRLDRAATAAHRMVEHFYPGPSTAEKRYLECVAALVDALAARGLEVQPGRRSPQHGCTDRAIARYAYQLESEGGSAGGFERYAPAYEAVGNPYTAPIGPRGRMLARPVSLERLLIDDFLLHPSPMRDGQLPRPGDPYGKLSLIYYQYAQAQYSSLGAFAAELALFNAYAGFPERSRELWPILDRVATLIEGREGIHLAIEPDGVDPEGYMLSHVMSVAAAAALFGGDFDRMQRYAAMGEVHSAAVVTQYARMLDLKNPWEMPIEDSHWHDHEDVFRAMASGDEARVVAVLTSQHSTGRDTLPRVVQRLHTNRDAFQAWFVDKFPAPCLTCGASTMLGHLSDRREVARVLGGHAATEWDSLREPARKFVDALTDTSIAWELDELETFFARGR